MRLARYDTVTPSKQQRRAFDCGHQSLNVWLQTQARQSMDTRDAVTYLLMDEGAPGEPTIAGYYCLSAGQVDREVMPSSLSARAPQPVPVIRLGRLAVSLSYRGRALGRDLLAEALHSSLSAADLIGARALLVDAIDDHAVAFYRRWGFAPSPIHPMQLMVRVDVLRASASAVTEPGTVTPAP